MIARAPPLLAPAPAPSTAASAVAGPGAAAAALPGAGVRSIHAPASTDHMRIVSWNCNGLRSPSMKSNPLPALFSAYGADIFCLQESKISSYEDVPREAAVVPGFDAFFSFSRARKGWSGTVTYVRQGCTVAAREDMDDPDLDGEGRIVCTDHARFVLFNVYFPNAGTGPERLAYKLRFYAAFERHVRRLLDQGRHVIIVGDINTAHQAADIWSPEKFEGGSGFLPEERAWMDGLIRTDLTAARVREAKGEGVGVGEENNAEEHYDASFLQPPEPIAEVAALPPPAATATAAVASCVASTTTSDLAPSAASSSSTLSAIPAAAPVDPPPPFVDSFRFFHPYRKGAYSFWDMRTQKRQENLGWRIDYMLVDTGLMLECVVDAQLHPRQLGSDHCPTSLSLQLPPLPHPAAAAPAAADSSATAAAAAAAAAADAHAARIGAFLGVSPFPYPTPSMAARHRAQFKEQQQQQQGSLLSFFARKPSGSGASGDSSSGASATASKKRGKSPPRSTPPATTPAPPGQPTIVSAFTAAIDVGAATISTAPTDAPSQPAGAAVQAPASPPRKKPRSRN